MLPRLDTQQSMLCQGLPYLSHTAAYITPHPPTTHTQMPKAAKTRVQKNCASVNPDGVPETVVFKPSVVFGAKRFNKLAKSYAHLTKTELQLIRFAVPEDASSELWTNFWLHRTKKFLFKLYQTRKEDSIYVQADCAKVLQNELDALEENCSFKRWYILRVMQMTLYALFKNADGVFGEPWGEIIFETVNEWMNDE